MKLNWGKIQQDISLILTYSGQTSVPVCSGEQKCTPRVNPTSP